MKISTSEYTNDEENSIGYWKADNILGNNFIDHSPNQNHGIIYGATWIEIDEDLDDCLSNQYDCAGICDGNAVLDECGVCEGPGIAEGTCDCEGSLPAENFDCSGNCLADIDCAGTCGGNAVLDECGNCDSTPENDCYQDCLGVWDGDAILDSNGDCCPNSSLIDECGICEGTGLITWFFDFDGDGWGGSDATELACPNSTLPSGWVVNNDDLDDSGQGYCISNEFMQMYEDIDGDGFGCGDYTIYCIDNMPGNGWVSNHDDGECECSTNDTDQCGICGGDNDCVGCMDESAFNYEEKYINRM